MRHPLVSYHFYGRLGAQSWSLRGWSYSGIWWRLEKVLCDFLRRWQKSVDNFCYHISGMAILKLELKCDLLLGSYRIWSWCSWGWVRLCHTSIRRLCAACRASTKVHGVPRFAFACERALQISVLPVPTARWWTSSRTDLRPANCVRGCLTWSALPTVCCAFSKCRSSGRGSWWDRGKPEYRLWRSLGCWSHIDLSWELRLWHVWIRWTEGTGYEEDVYQHGDPSRWGCLEKSC